MGSEFHYGEESRRMSSPKWSRVAKGAKSWDKVVDKIDGNEEHVGRWMSHIGGHVGRTNIGQVGRTFGRSNSSVHVDGHARRIRWGCHWENE